MYSVWTKHLTDDKEKERFASTVQGSKVLLDRLTDILTEMETQLDRFELDPANYDIANWSYKQADANGSRRILRKIKNLIDLDQQSVPTKAQ